MSVQDEFNKAAEEEQQSTEKRKPDSIVYYEQVGKDGKKDLVRFGAAWKHNKGEGLSITLDHGAKLVIFPNKHK